jgi:hypothetical protein
MLQVASDVALQLLSTHFGTQWGPPDLTSFGGLQAESGSRQAVLQEALWRVTHFLASLTILRGGKSGQPRIAPQTC